MKVSVLMTTYNHEMFIAQAIESVLRQQTNFDFELIIGEDCSTDRTRFICEELRDKYPNIITLISNKTNIYPRNFENTFAHCKGEYIAILEGDDYWIEPSKLQQQVDFLETHEEFSICFGNVKIERNDRIDESEHGEYYKKILANRTEFGIEDILKGNFIPTCTVMYRRRNIYFPDWKNQIPFGDWTLNVLNALCGKIKYIDDYFGTYRVHEGGVWSSKSLQFRESAISDFYRLINEATDHKFSDIILSVLVDSKNYYLGLSSDLLKEKQQLEYELSETQKELHETTLIHQPLMNSWSYKFANKIDNVLSSILPHNTLRRSFLRFNYKLVRSLYRKSRIQMRRTRLIISSSVNKIGEIINRLRTKHIKNEKWPANLPLISVIIPCFNYGKYVEAAIDSVLSQTLQNFEIIVVDGGSTDGSTHEVLRKLDKPKMTICFRDGRHLVGDNRNYGIEKAKGKYICCLDADDMLKPTYFEKSVFYLENFNYDGVYPSVQCFGLDQTRWYARPVSFTNMIKNGNYIATVAIFKKELWAKYGKIRDWPIGEGHVPEDWEFWFRLLGNGAIFIPIVEPLMLYRKHGSGLTVECQTTREEQNEVIIRENSSLLNKENIRRIRRKSSVSYSVKYPNINLSIDKKKKTILFALPSVIIGGAHSILAKIAICLKENGCDISIISTMIPDEAFEDNTTGYDKITKEIYNLYDFLRNLSEWKAFLFYLIESRELDVLFVNGCEFVRHLLPEIRGKYPKLRIVDQSFNEHSDSAKHEVIGKSIGEAIHQRLVTFFDNHDFIIFAPWIMVGGADRLIVAHVKVLQESNYSPCIVTTIRSGDRIDLINIPHLDLGEDLASWNNISLSEQTYIILEAILDSKIRFIHIIQSSTAYQMFKAYSSILSEIEIRVLISLYTPGYDEINDQYYGYPVDFPEAMINADMVLLDNEYWYSQFAKWAGKPFKYRKLHTPVPCLDKIKIEPSCNKKILWASRISDQKLISVLYDICKKMPEYTFIIYGGSPEEKQVEEYFDKLMLLPNVVFKGIFKDINEIDIDQVDLYLFTSKFEGIATLLLDIASLGLPIVMADVGGLSEVTGNNYPLLVRDYHSSHAYIDKIMEYYSDIDMYFEQMRGIRESVIKMHSEEDFRNSYLNIINELS